MPFPINDRHWNNTVAFIKRHYHEGERVLAPDEFVEHFNECYRYLATFARPDLEYSWVAVHKGRLDGLSCEFVANLDRDGHPVYADEVFVVFSTDKSLPQVDPTSLHLLSFRTKVPSLRNQTPPNLGANPRIKPRPPIHTLSTDEIRQEMNLRYSNSGYDEFGGYEHDHLWDRVRFQEVNRLVTKLMQDTQGLTVLEVGCGLGRYAPIASGCREYLGIDLSDVAIEKAGKTYANRPNMSFRRMDAAQLDLPDRYYDVVLSIEMIEHVHDPINVLQEAYRVLKPGGLFMVNSINRDSLHMRMIRMLGHQEFVGTIEHIREFAFSEMKEILEEIGFNIENSAGVFLMPYFGIPDVDGPVRHLTDDDPEVVEMFRDLGERAGADYGYEFILTARKPA